MAKPRRRTMDRRVQDRSVRSMDGLEQRLRVVLDTTQAERERRTFWARMRARDLPTVRNT